MGAIWLLFHNLVYSGNDVASFSTFVFGVVVSEFGNVFGYSVLPGVNEILLFFVFIIGVLSAGYYFFVSRLKSKSGFNVFKFVFFPILMGAIWLLFHNLVYSGNDVASFSTFVFGVVGPIVTGKQIGRAHV